MVLKSLEVNLSLTDRAYAIIKEAILSLQLEPGTLLLEDRLAEQLKISKTPVRDALQQLERDGLVTRIPYKGTYVTDISEQDVREITELKAVLEGMAGRLAVDSMTEEDLNQAETFLKASEAALKAGNLDEASRQGTQFHRFIFQHTSNKRLEKFLIMLDDQMQRFSLTADRTPGRMEISATEHREILAVLRGRDPAAVEATFRKHLTSFRNDLLKDLALTTAPEEPASRFTYADQV